MDNRAIGVFDSGLGGLTSAKVLEELLPNEDIVYFGDSARMPYGSRSREEIQKLALEGARFLHHFDVKAILIACGTISSNAFELLQSSFETPFFGVVDAACRAAVRLSENKRIGVIATPASIKSGVYERGIKALAENAQVISQGCPFFAEMVEQGHFRVGDPLAEKVVAEQVSVFKDSGLDLLLLGCTHYPLLQDIIAENLGHELKQISSGAEAAHELAEHLSSIGALSEKKSEPKRLWFTSGDTGHFSETAEIFLGHRIECKNPGIL